MGVRGGAAKLNQTCLTSIIQDDKFPNPLLTKATLFLKKKRK